MSQPISRRNLPPLDELAAICGGEGTRGEGEPRDLRRLYARLVRRLSIRITRVLLPTGISLLQLSFVLDFCDGEIARFERDVEGVTSGAGGAYLDWVGHYYIPALMSGALGWAVFHETGDWWWLAAALVIVLSLVRVPYSARDHIMWGVYRDRPELRDSEPMVRAALARMGGDPESLDLNPDPETRMAGGEGRGLLWSRHTNFGQLIVFPGFVNLVSAAAVIDMLLSSGGGVDEIMARATLLALLGAVHLLHQIRAIAQGFRVTRALQ
ncbi:MAG: hypothetical protein HZB14_09720 [Actinobacteria bacterium]|nr:hypothetical protein [Actinomycetota bacterium]